MAATVPRVDGQRRRTHPEGAPDGGRRTAELIPGARFELIEGMGHDYPPQLWSRWVDLLAEHTGV